MPSPVFVTTGSSTMKRKPVMVYFRRFLSQIAEMLMNVAV